MCVHVCVWGWGVEGSAVRVVLDKLGDPGDTLGMVVSRQVSPLDLLATCSVLTRA